ncbi:organomercurial lyase [Microbacterium timonense]|uniref:organomercurial lyase n=1 Tax=Microbacterium timonense TaxID=2086576 RepID=UPI000D10EEAF|nr:organomercurial lyase [Microbacterium timonense]
MADAETLRLRIYRQLADEGRVDRLGILAADIGEDERTTAALLGELERNRHVVLDERGEIELAHPFATRDFGFSVKSDRTLWWGGCAWDSFAIPHLVPGASPSLIATTCPSCGTAHAWVVDSGNPPAGEQVAHFLVPMAHVWDDVVHTCENQRIFCSEACVDEWLERSTSPRGDVFDLATLWRLASHWYSGRLEPGYRRREPTAAAAYFRDAGLTGPFWGL